MRRSLQAATLSLTAALALSLAACGDDPAPTEPPDDGGNTTLVTETCIDCHSSQEALQASTSASAVVAAGPRARTASDDG